MNPDATLKTPGTLRTTLDPGPNSVALAPPPRGRRRLVLWCIGLICTLPFPLAVLLYAAPDAVLRVPLVGNVVQSLTPERRNNYGALIEPQRPLAGQEWRTLDGTPFDLGQLRGKWVMLSLGRAACDEVCARRLFTMRQVRASTGQDQMRVERVWLITDSDPIEPRIPFAYPGMHIVRAQTGALALWLPAAEGPGTDAAIYLIDPLGHLMLQWPAAADPVRVRKDLVRLLWTSRVG